MYKILIIYKTKDNKEPFNIWLNSKKDKTLRNRIRVRLTRVIQGNYGDYKRFDNILELRFNFGKGHRIYCGEDQDTLVILLTGGDKSTQQKGIKKAK